jgi:hypothetical protein
LPLETDSILVRILKGCEIGMEITRIPSGCNPMWERYQGLRCACPWLPSAHPSGVRNERSIFLKVIASSIFFR